MKSRCLAIFIFACTIFSGLAALSFAGSPSERSCSRGKGADEVLAIANSKADKFGYQRDQMFMELLGPMRWQTLADSHYAAVRLHPEVAKQWSKELTDHCIWSVYFGCEPPHREFGGFTGCLDYPQDLWLFIDNQTGSILHFERQTGKEWGYRVDR